MLVQLLLPPADHQWLPDQLRVEPFGLDAATLANLPPWAQDRGTVSLGNAIVVTPDQVGRQLDPRGEGSPGLLVYRTGV